MYLNKVILIGNLTRDPEMKNLPSGTSVANLGIATNRVWKDANGDKKEDTQFHNIVVFGRQAETVGQYLNKGSSVLIEGRLQTRSWDGTDGQKRYRTEIVADRVQFGPKSSGGGNSSSYSNQNDDSNKASSGSSDSGAVEYPEEEINPDDIPF